MQQKLRQHRHRPRQLRLLQLHQLRLLQLHQQRLHRLQRLPEEKKLQPQCREPFWLLTYPMVPR